MSLIIKGMELPQHAAVNGEKDTAYKRYPIIEIPTPHGDLVERDDLTDEINRVTFAERYDYNVAYNIVTEAETIIEAEVSE